MKVLDVYHGTLVKETDTRLPFAYYFKGKEPKAMQSHFMLMHILSRIGSTEVECLTRDRGAAGSSLTGVTALCP